eukprot:2545892-Pleurochrysis_carterae.AAC.1
MNKAFKKWKLATRRKNNNKEGKTVDKEEEEKEQIYGIKHWSRVVAISRKRIRVKNFLQTKTTTSSTTPNIWRGAPYKSRSPTSTSRYGAKPHIKHGSKPPSQSVQSRYPSDIAIEADYLAFCPRGQIISNWAFARARHLLSTVVARTLSLWFNTHMHCLPIWTRVACMLAERSRSAHQVLESTLAMAAAAP